MSTPDINDIIQIVVSVTGGRVAASAITSDTQLLGSIPEIDSMGIMNIILALETRFGFQIDDEEVDAAIFENAGALHTFVQMKLNSSLTNSAGSD